MKVIIMGSTGMIGKGVLIECLEARQVESILIINRQSAGIQHDKLREVIHKDFYDFSSIRPVLKGYDVCFFCLGISSAGLSEEEYHKITYDLTNNFARELIPLNPESTFCYVSGAGTDSSEKGRTMWARVKGKIENTLLAMPFRNAFMFRPGFIKPMKGIRSRTRVYRILYDVFKPLYYLLRPFNGLVTNTEELAKVMIRVAEHGYDKNIIGMKDINRIAGKIGEPAG